jgi:hypothetical protein
VAKRTRWVQYEVPLFVRVDIDDSYDWTLLQAVRGHLAGVLDAKSTDPWATVAMAICSLAA